MDVESWVATVHRVAKSWILTVIKQQQILTVRTGLDFARPPVFPRNLTGKLPNIIWGAGKGLSLHDGAQDRGALTCGTERRRGEEDEAGQAKPGGQDPAETRSE